MTAKSDPNLTKGQKLAVSWKTREAYHGLTGTKLHTVWRSFRFTLKGKRAGCSHEWREFKNFYHDMMPSYKEGSRLGRTDKSGPFSKENCKWVENKELCAGRLLKVTHNGQSHTIREWAEILEIPYNGIRKRYYAKGYTPQEVLYGRARRSKRGLVDQAVLDVAKKRLKASKMISSYKCRDRKRSHQNDLKIDWFIENILQKSCIYCGSEKHVGADRLDNNHGHTMENIVPSCFRCNATRSDHFSHEEMLLIGAFIRDVIDIRRNQ